MKHFTCRSYPVRWFTSYLKDRHQLVEGDKQSNVHVAIVRQGIPQRSMLGPLLFIVFINGLQLYVTSSRIDLYADDTTLTSSTSHSSIGWLEGILNSSVTKSSIGQLLTNYQLMKVKPRLCSSSSSQRLHTKINEEMTKGTELELVPSAKLLGLQIDSELSFPSPAEKLNFVKSCQSELAY